MAGCGVLAAMMTARIRNWDIALAAYLDERLHANFEWGRHDCAMFTAGAVEVMTGQDLAQSFRGAYDSERDARKVLRAHGGLAKIVDAMLPRTVSGHVDRGDVVLVHDDYSRRDALGICLGDFAVAPAKHGLSYYPMSHVVIAWKV